MDVAIKWIAEYLGQVHQQGEGKRLRALYSTKDGEVAFPCSSDHGVEPIVHYVFDEGMTVVASYKPVSSLVAKQVASASAHRRLHSSQNDPPLMLERVTMERVTNATNAQTAN